MSKSVYVRVIHDLELLRSNDSFNFPQGLIKSIVIVVIVTTFGCYYDRYYNYYCFIIMIIVAVVVVVAHFM